MYIHLPMRGSEVPPQSACVQYVQWEDTSNVATEILACSTARLHEHEARAVRRKRIEVDEIVVGEVGEHSYTEQLFPFKSDGLGCVEKEGFSVLFALLSIN